MSSPVASRALVVIDAPAGVQPWADALTRWAQLGGPAWPGQSHAKLPTGVITVARLWDVIDQQFYLEEDPWSVARHGLPMLVLPDGSTFGSGTAPTLPPEPNPGSMWHNTLHACLGNFHS